MSQVNPNRLPKALRETLLATVNHFIWVNDTPRSTGDIVEYIRNRHGELIPEIQKYGSQWGVVTGICVALGMRQYWGRP